MGKQRRTASDAALLALFQQSWEYARHAHSMLWQSFATLCTATAVVLAYTIDKAGSARTVGIIASITLSSVGFLVATRAVIVVREHFLTINRARRECGLDGSDVVPNRWKNYLMKDFKLRRPEVIYMVLVQQLYAIGVAALVCCLAFSSVSVPDYVPFALGLAVFAAYETYAYYQLIRSAR